MASPNAICAGLFSRGDGTFHWALILPDSNGDAYKIHATNNRGGGWFYEGIVHTDIFHSKTLCVLVQIGTLSNRGAISQMEQILATIPMTVPLHQIAREPNFTCRVWFKEAVRILHVQGFIRCPNVDALESELFGYGRAQDGRTVMGSGFKIYVSTCCY